MLEEMLLSLLEQNQAFLRLSFLAILSVIPSTKSDHHNPTCTSVNLTIATVLPYHTGMFFDLEMVGPALDITLENLISIYPRMNITMIYLKVPGIANCDDFETAIADETARLYYQQFDRDNPIAAWLGPGCTNTVGQMATLAKEWDLPVLDGTATAAFLADKRRFPTLIRFAFNQSRVMQLFQALLSYFNWTNLAVIYAEGDPIWDLGVTSAQRFFAPYNRTVSLILLPMKKTLTFDAGIDDLLTRLSKSARVAVIYASGEFVRQFLIKAYIAGMANGQFAYFMNNFFKSKFFGYPLRSKKGDNDTIAQLAMQSLFQFSMNQRSDEFSGFQERVYARALSDYNYSFFPDQDVNVHVVGYTDALRLFIHVVQEILSTSFNRGNLRGSHGISGLEVAQRMRNRTYRSVAGFKRLNDNGDVDGNFMIKNYNRSSNDFEGAIVFNQGDTEISLLKDLSLDWYDGFEWPPRNAPACGYDGDDLSCRQHGTRHSAIVAVGVSCVLAYLFLLLAVIKWRFVRDAKLRQSWWLLQNTVTIKTKTPHGQRSVNSARLYAYPPEWKHGLSALSKTSFPVNYKIA